MDWTQIAEIKDEIIGNHVLKLNWPGLEHTAGNSDCIVDSVAIAALRNMTRKELIEMGDQIQTDVNTPQSIEGGSNPPEVVLNRRRLNALNLEVNKAMQTAMPESCIVVQGPYSPYSLKTALSEKMKKPVVEVSARGDGATLSMVFDSGERMSNMDVTDEMLAAAIPEMALVHWFHPDDRRPAGSVAVDRLMGDDAAVFKECIQNLDGEGLAELSRSRMKRNLRQPERTAARTRLSRDAADLKGLKSGDLLRRRVLKEVSAHLAHESGRDEIAVDPR